MYKDISLLRKQQVLLLKESAPVTTHGSYPSRPAKQANRGS